MAIIRQKKKRIISSPGETSAKKRQTYIKDYWLNKTIISENPFNLLATDEDTEDNTQKVHVEKISKSPPIFVSGVEDIGPLTKLLDEIDGKNYSLKILANNQVKILPSMSEKYLPIIEGLKKKKTEFYTYQRKQDKSYKAVLRNMHPSTDLEDLKAAIEEYEHKVIRITNIRERTTQKSLPLFIIEIEPKDNNKSIFNIDKLLNIIVSFEPLRKKREIPQRQKCQGYGHTKNYCFKSPVCVKCAMNHLTPDCPTKGKIKEVKCANCDGNHPASYKGCLVRKQLQQKLYPTLRKKSANQQTQNHLQNLHRFVKPNITYAHTVRSDHKQYTTNTTQPQIETQTTTNTSVTATSKLEQMMTQLMSRMDTMLNLLTSLINKIQ